MSLLPHRRYLQELLLSLVFSTGRYINNSKLWGWIEPFIKTKSFQILSGCYVSLPHALLGKVSHALIIKMDFTVESTNRFPISHDLWGLLCIL